MFTCNTAPLISQEGPDKAGLKSGLIRPSA